MAATTINYGGAGDGYHFSVIFYDGEQESHIGKIYVTPFTDFKSFQHSMSTKIGISPNQFTTFLKHQSNPQRKIPITQKLNFLALLQDTKYYFYVSLKRKKKLAKQSGVPFSVANNVMLLRRGDAGFYATGARDLRVERDRFLAVLGRESDNVNGRLRPGGDGGGVGNAVCEECEKGNGEFHLCVKDAVVTMPLRSRFGPIARPPVNRDQ